MSSRIAPLDLLRGLAALTVALAHFVSTQGSADPLAPAIAKLGVEIFFVLSGFVLGAQLVFCASSGQARNLWIFLVRRWMRTVPPYLLALVLMSYATGQLGTGDFLRYALYVQNLFAPHNLRDYYPVAWSLSVEEWFYLVFPLFLFGLSRLSGVCHRRFLLIASLAFIVGIMALRASQGLPQAWDAEIRRITLFRLDCIACGFVLYLLVCRIEVRSHAAAEPLAAGLAFAVLAGATIWVALLADRSVQVAQYLFCFLAPVFGASAIWLFYLLQRYVENPTIGMVSRHLGQISYSVYLFHLLVFIVVEPHVENLSAELQLAASFACLWAVSSIVYHYFEKPILSARPDYSDPGAYPASHASRFA